jgi:hypothetical protein
MLDALITAALNWPAISAAQRAYSTIAARSVAPKQVELRIATSNPNNHLTGLVMRSTPPIIRNRQPGPHAVAFYVDRGIFTRFRFVGSTGSDRLTFGPQGVIISKRPTGVVDFGVDNAPDVFEFTNRINVAACSKKHGFPCHPLNHLQQVVVKNMGPEDLIILQGKTYRTSQVRNGALPNVPITRLRVEVLPN